MTAAGITHRFPLSTCFQPFQAPWHAPRGKATRRSRRKAARIQEVNQRKRNYKYRRAGNLLLVALAFIQHPESIKLSPAPSGGFWQSRLLAALRRSSPATLLPVSLPGQALPSPSLTLLLSKDRTNQLFWGAVSSQLLAYHTRHPFWVVSLTLAEAQQR